MKKLILFLCVAARLPAATPSLEALDAPGGGPIRLEVAAGERVTAISDYWRIEFDLRNGGVLDSIVFPAGSGKNLLLSPFASYIDQWSDENAPVTGFTQAQKGSVVRLEFSGRMAAAGRRPGPIEYRTTWTISPFFIRADHTLRLIEDVTVSAVGIGSTAVRADLNEFAVRSGPMVDDVAWQQRINTRYGTIGRAGTKVVDDRHAPLYLLFFNRGVEGFDLSTASDLATWERALAGRAGAGRFEASMCPTSGWLERRKRDIEQAYRELGFDGIYYDQVVNIGCTNTKHGTNLHLGVDGVVELLAWTRRLVAPDGPLILHIGGNRPAIIFENFADLVVNMEELSGAESSLQLEDLPLLTLLAESLPRSPCPSYRTDRSLERNRQNISILTVFGMFPWAGGGLDEVYGELYEETLKLFRAFKPYRLEQYKLHDALTGAVKTSLVGVYGAVYSSPEQAIVVLSNTSPEKRKNVTWRVEVRDLEIGQAADLLVKDSKTGRTQTVSASALLDGTLITDLDAYEYRLFEVLPAR